MDVAEEFRELGNVHFVGTRLADFDASTGRGHIEWQRYVRQPSLSFNKLDFPLVRGASTEFPESEYERDPQLPFEVSVVSPRTFRLRFHSRAIDVDRTPSLMLAGPVPADKAPQVSQSEEAITLSTSSAALRIERDPWRIVLCDALGNELTRTRSLNDPPSFTPSTPFSFIRREKDLTRLFACATTLKYDEQIFGCGESFTRFNKRGQRVIAMTRDALGAQSERMYKPIPFYMTSAGYGVFVHTSTPVSFDFGKQFDGTNIAYTGDETLDLFLFVGSPKQILAEYTSLTGRSPMPPAWSFGLWMSRITYNSAAELRDVATKLREYQIPCDVIHLDTGWFSQDWQCDFEFDSERFPDPAKMISDLRDQGLRLSLWQLPYFTPKNPLYQEAAQAGLFVKSQNGKLPAEDGVLDFSNPETVEWYQEKIRNLLRLGVAVIKVDFGEDAPLDGLYASGRTGWYERNLYPLRYNQLVSDLTYDTTDERLIWARSAWAGSQRYPLHWGGDAENSYSAMAASLRAGLSFGLSGFTYWSHDAGGFVNAPDKELYARWLAMAALSSHTRCHGAPPREPWLIDDEFVDLFRRTIAMRYRLLPYLLSEAAASSEAGLPLLRPLFVEYPHDRTSWLIDDQYLLGSKLLVAPLFADTESRDVYLPPGRWVDYQTGNAFEGPGWHPITAGEIPIVVLVPEGTLLAHAELAQHTGDIDWSHLDVVLYGKPNDKSVATIHLPGRKSMTMRVEPPGDGIRDELQLLLDSAGNAVECRLKQVPGAPPTD
ncbi:alpha-galactosidase [Aeoliella sp. ICT_H6.2]|uniref:Alpha-galactosidase n=1 Tax=Aeoliella straminimaris TaxID=2954799 RepID=A0A9X2JGV8_9BACT|nr:alpha-galactosidase [Aeoliella straminimaris]